MKKKKQPKLNQKDFWWWFLVGIAIVIIWNLIDDSDKLDDYGLCVDGCRSELYCIEYDIQDNSGNWYMDVTKFDSCRVEMFSCLDRCNNWYR